MIDVLTGKNINKKEIKEIMPWELAHDHNSMSPQDSVRCKMKDEQAIKLVIPAESEYVKVEIKDSD